MPIKVAVGSANPVKINAAKNAFSKVFNTQEGVQEADSVSLVSSVADIVTVESVSVGSGVADQPMSIEETRQGAENRVMAMKELVQADYYIAYEGGVDVFEDGPKTFAIICISDANRTVFGQSACLPLPLRIYEALLNGEELGSAMDNAFDTINIKQKGGAIGQLTRGLESRQSIYTSATILSLSPFVFKDLYD